MVPSLIAQDLVGVQPMTSPTASVFKMKMKMYESKHDKAYIFEGKKHGEFNIVHVMLSYKDWIMEQPKHMWIDFHDTYEEVFVYSKFSHTAYHTFAVNDELLAWITLKWG